MATNKQGLYYLKDKKAAIYHPISIRNSRGYYVLTYLVPVAPADMWCYARQLTQDQLYAAHAFMESETKQFVFNYYQGVKLYDLLRYKGAWYEITRVDTADDYNGELFVYVKDYKGSTITDDMILPYGVEPPSE